MPTSHSRRDGTTRTRSNRTRTASTTTPASSQGSRVERAGAASPGPSAQLVAESPAALTEAQTWMSYEQVCDLLGESRHTLNKWRRRPELNFPAALRKPNNHLMFRRADVAAFIANLEVAR